MIDRNLGKAKDFFSGSEHIFMSIGNDKHDEDLSEVPDMTNIVLKYGFD